VAKLVAESKARNVDIQIFYVDSAEILPQARPSLDEFGKALSNPRLAGRYFPHRRGTPTPRVETLWRCRNGARIQSKPLIQTYHVDRGPLRPYVRRGAAQE